MRAAIDDLPPPLIVYERTSRWAAALRRELASDDRLPAPRVVETRSVAEFLRRLAASYGEFGAVALPVVELTTADAADVCTLLARLVHIGPDAPTAVVADATAADYEWAARTAGASLFVGSSRGLRRLVEAYYRFAADARARRRPIDEEDERLPARRMWDALPWPTSSRA